MATGSKQISTDVCGVLATLHWNDNGCQIKQQLDRDLYTRVNKVLEALGGKWNRKLKCHVFDSSDPQSLVEIAAATGEYVDEKVLFQFYATPHDVVERMMDCVEDWDGIHSILEPSAGEGALIQDFTDRMRPGITAIELHEGRAAKLDEMGVADRVMCGDFLKAELSDFPELFDLVLMNPPFTKQQDVLHVVNALRFLNPGGQLVSVMSPTWRDRNTTAARDLRAMLGSSLVEDSAFEMLPEGSFKASGTMVNAGILHVKRSMIENPAVSAAREQEPEDTDVKVEAMTVEDIAAFLA